MKMYYLKFLNYDKLSGTIQSTQELSKYRPRLPVRRLQHQPACKGFSRLKHDINLRSGKRCDSIHFFQKLCSAWIFLNTLYFSTVSSLFNSNIYISFSKVVNIVSFAYLIRLENDAHLQYCHRTAWDDLSLWGRSH